MSGTIRLQYRSRADFIVGIFKDNFHKCLTLQCFQTAILNEKFSFIEAGLQDDLNSALLTILFSDGNAPTTSQVLASLIYIYKYRLLDESAMLKCMIAWTNISKECGVTDAVWLKFLKEILQYNSLGGLKNHNIEFISRNGQEKIV